MRKQIHPVLVMRQRSVKVVSTYHYWWVYNGRVFKNKPYIPNYKYKWPYGVAKLDLLSDHGNHLTIYWVLLKTLGFMWTKSNQFQVCVCLYVCVSHRLTWVTPWTAACQAPLSTEFSRQEYWSGLPFPSAFECNIIQFNLNIPLACKRV